MGPDKSDSLFEHGSILMGAIFMSNRKTKRECISRRLFGSPSFQADFVKKIKVGMILFLFEYEQRKLYGVFEATSDGALDIIPMAFMSSGRLFPAQVSFRTIWYCDPLTEAEFYDAIKENYYSDNKFHFHLSETQVYKLLHLFDSKKIAKRWDCSRGRRSPSESRNCRKKGVKKYQNFRSGKDEFNTESETDLNRFPNLPGNNLVHSSYSERALQNADNAAAVMETAPYPTTLLEQPGLPDIVDSTFRDEHVFKGNIPVSSQDNYFHQLVPGLHMKMSPANSNMANAYGKELASYSNGSLLKSHPFRRGQFYHSHTDQGIPKMPTVYQNFSVSSGPQHASYALYESTNPQRACYAVYQPSSSSLPALSYKDTGCRPGITNLQDSTAKDFQNRVSEANLRNSDHSSSPGFYDPYTPNIFSSNQGNYINLHGDTTTSVNSPSRSRLLAYGQSVDNLRGPTYFRLEPDEVTPYSEYKLGDLEIIESPFCGSPEKAPSQMLYESVPSQYQDEGSSYYHLNEDDEYYPDAVSSKFHSDCRERRTSVFLRLSGSRKAFVEKSETHMADLDVPLSELIASLSSRRKYWNKMTKVPILKKSTKLPGLRKMKLAASFRNVSEVPEQFAMLDDGQQLENADQLEPETSTLCKRELSCSEEGAEKISILPFLNFKRRSETQKRTGETETSSSVECRASEESLVRHKRRKLIRPSFGVDVLDKFAEVQNFLGATEELLLRGNSDESSEVAARIGNETNAASGNDDGAGGTSQEHFVEQTLVTALEHVPNVESSPASQTDVAKAAKLESEGTTFIRSQGNFQNIQESFQNLHGNPHLLVDGNNNKSGECLIRGSKEAEMVILSLGPHNDTVELGASNILSGGQYRFQNVQSRSKRPHRDLFFVQTDESKGGVEHGDAPDKSASGSEGRHEVEYSCECRSCNCNIEGLSENHVCQTSANVAQDIRKEELLLYQSVAHCEATGSNKEENICASTPFADSDSKNIEDSQRNLVVIDDTQEENIGAVVHFREFDTENTDDLQRNLVSIIVGVEQPSSSTCIFYSDGEAFRDGEEEKVGAERKAEVESNDKKISRGGVAGTAKGIGTGELLSNPLKALANESAAGLTVKFCGKMLTSDVIDKETNTTHQNVACTSKDIGVGGSSAKPCTAHAVKPTENTEEDHVIVGRLLSDVVDEDVKTACRQTVSVGKLCLRESSSNPVADSS